MSQPFMSEIKLVSFNFAPKGWAECNGQFLPINQNQALFSLLGTTYGGNGQTTFALPNLQGQVPIHMGNSHTLGEKGGETAHTLSIPELTTHTHFVQASSSDATAAIPAGNYLAKSAPGNPYIGPTNLATLNAGTVANTGGSQAHNNMMPYLVLNFIIALQGIFPSQN
jgi:microcystin-dependent protein